MATVTERRKRPIHIYAVDKFSRGKRRRLIAVVQAISLRKGLEDYAKRREFKDPIITGNTLSVRVHLRDRLYEAHEANHPRGGRKNAS